MSFTDVYQAKLRTPEQIAAEFQPGCVCCSDNGVTVPGTIYGALRERALGGGISGVTIHTFLDTIPVPCYDEDMKDVLSGVTWFSGAYARKAVAGGFADIMPCYYRDVPDLVRDYLDYDTFCAAVSPMDKHGYFTTGGSASNSVSMIRNAKRIFLEVNRNMPRALSGPIIHISQVDALCETDAELPCIASAPPDAISTAIGQLIAAEIPDGATIQLGIGGIPNAVAAALISKRDLGIHSEMFADGMIDLLECGAVNNSRKPIHTGRTVATFALGSRRLYDYIDDNPAVQMLPVDYVNDPAVIARHPNFISVNAAVEVDFYGQVAAESVGTRHISGTGGQADFVRGAIQSKGGKSFIAFPSTAMGGAASKIAPTLTPGAIVTTGKNDVDHIVTEYGIAKLRGRTLSQRAKALIAIAHPKFREELTFAAKKLNILV